MSLCSLVYMPGDRGAPRPAHQVDLGDAAPLAGRDRPPRRSRARQLRSRRSACSPPAAGSFPAAGSSGHSPDIDEIDVVAARRDQIHHRGAFDRQIERGFGRIGRAVHVQQDLVGREMSSCRRDACCARRVRSRRRRTGSWCSRVTSSGSFGGAFIGRMLSSIAGSVKSAASGDVPRGGQARQRIGQLFAIERLDQKTVHAGLEAGIAILHQRVRGQRQDRRAADRAARPRGRGFAWWFRCRRVAASGCPSAPDRRARRRISPPARIPAPPRHWW